MIEVRLEPEEMQLIAATTMMMNRVMGHGMAQHLAQAFLNPFGINLTRGDAQVICAMMGALQREVRKDRVLSASERMLVITRAQNIINKLESSYGRTAAIL